MPSLENKTLALVGAPCSGKSEINKALLPIFTVLNSTRDLRADDPYFRVRDEAWADYQFFAEMLVKLLALHTELTVALMLELEGVMKKTIVRTDTLPSIEGVEYEDFSGYYESTQINALTGESEVIWKRDISLFNQYRLYDFQFLRVVNQPIASEKELRKLMQADLLNAQLLRETAWSLEAHGQNRVTVSDGALASIWTYLDDLESPYLRAVLHRWNLENITSRDLLHRYPCVVLLETLANLGTGKFEHYFNDGRRMDSPDHASKMHKRLVSLCEGHPRVITLPASMRLDEKIDTVLQLVYELATG